MNYSIASGGLKRLQAVMLPILAVFFGLLGPIAHSAQAAPTVSARLSQDTVAQGESVELVVSVEGSAGTDEYPRAIDVDGLQIQFRGISRQIRIFNGAHSQVASYTYEVTPDRTGTFTIPAITLKVDGKAYSTQPVTLKVEAAGTSNNSKEENLFFAELTATKPSAYVGEMIPVEMRLYVDARIRWEPEHMPIFAGEGFTKQKMPDPRREQARRNGKDYDVLVFRTAISPSKAGKLSIGPCKIQFRAQIPDARRKRPRSPLAEAFGNDPFFDAMFQSGEIKQITVTAPAIDLEVKSLPTEGKPADFSGAIGQFQLETEGAPATVKVGDPVTMTFRVTGRGNFDRVNAPGILQSNGWHNYPPSADFKPEDDLSLTGTKTFVMAVIPEVVKSSMPQFSFSYFDPDKQKYMTLTSAQIPLTVEPGSQKPAATPQAAETHPQSQPTSTGPSPTPVPENTGIAEVHYELGPAKSFTPLWTDRSFLFLQGIPALLLATFTLWRITRPNEAAQRTHQLKKQRGALLSKLRDETARGAFLETANALLQTQVALQTGQSTNAIDSAKVVQVLKADPQESEIIQEILDARAEQVFAGTSQNDASKPMPPRKREEFLKTVESLLSRHE